MSAQRSRMKQKLHYKNMEAKNKFLKAKINELSIQNSRLSYENSQLKENIYQIQKLYDQAMQRESKSESER